MNWKEKIKICFSVGVLETKPCLWTGMWEQGSILLVLRNYIILQNTFISLVVIQKELNKIMMTKMWKSVLRVECVSRREVIRAHEPRRQR